MAVELGLTVAIATGVAALVGILVTIYKIARKVDDAVNKKCPCTAVEDIQKTVTKHAEYLSRDSKSIRELDKRTSILETEVQGIKNTLDRIDENVMKILTRN